VQQSGLQTNHKQSLNYVSIATNTEGYLATDLHDLVSRAIHQATIRAAKEKSEVRPRFIPCQLRPDIFQTILREEDFNAAQVDFTPLSLRDVKLQKSDISWADIGGVLEATLRHAFSDIPQACMKHGESYGRLWNGPRNMPPFSPTVH